jgi:hypothetical protein
LVYGLAGLLVAVDKVAAVTRGAVEGARKLAAEAGGQAAPAANGAPAATNGTPAATNGAAAETRVGAPPS